MGDRCSYSGISVDGTTARVTAFLTVLVAGAAVITASFWVLLPLAADFAVRARGGGRRSPLGWAAARLATALGLEPRPVDGGPKAFAAGVGLVASLTAALLALAGWTWAATAVAGVLVICAALEAFAGFCVGCLMYSMLQRAAARLGLPARQP
ncbi:MAG: DUF4395 domain-containing protein [Deltaproteobacteria bacterium]|nr:DUF4395 domain-containing protein [Deltaproteobacteria bacterium]